MAFDSRTKDRAAKVVDACAAPIIVLGNTRLWCRVVDGFGLSGEGLTGDAFAFKVVDRVLDGLDGLSVVVGDFDLVVVGAELFFERHDEFNHVQRVSIEILGE